MPPKDKKKSKRRSSKLFSRIGRRLSNNNNEVQAFGGGGEEPITITNLTYNGYNNNDNDKDNSNTASTKRKRSRLSLLSRSSSSNNRLSTFLSTSDSSVTGGGGAGEEKSSIEDSHSNKDITIKTEDNSNSNTMETKESVSTFTVKEEVEVDTGETKTQQQEITIKEQPNVLLHHEEYSPLSAKYLAQGRTNTHHNRHPSHHSHSKYIYHTYDHRFSTTALSQLAAASENTSSYPSSRGESPMPNKKSKSSGNLSFDDPLLYRTGSRVWEEVKESKGQVWLDTRQTSTGYDEGKDDEDYSKTEDENEEDDDGVLRMGKIKSVVDHDLDRENNNEWYTERIFIGNSEKEGDVEDDDDAGEGIFVRNKFIGLIDWALGLQEDSVSPTVQKQLSKERKPLTKREKIQQRDEGQPTDVAWYLGLLSNMF